MNTLPSNHFVLFGLPERFAIDRDALEAAYRRVQAMVHPDRHATAGDAERRVAMQWAAQANEAVRVLRDPVARGAYLAGLRGAPVRAESNTAMPSDFLLRQMEWHEALDEVRAGQGDEAALRIEVQSERTALLAALGEALDTRHDAAGAAALVRQLMFVDRVLAGLD